MTAAVQKTHRIIFLKFRYQRVPAGFRHVTINTNESNLMIPKKMLNAIEDSLKRLEFR
jgi:hypothetical protein